MTDTQASAPKAEATPFYQKPLYKLLDTTFAAKPFRTVQGLLDVAALATAIEMTGEGVYKWIRSDRISVDGAKKLIKLSNDKITKEDFLPFIMN